tara:strand:- start:1914 stop:3308 length:1395 start_codon:yes stop_codon:yes gene_type:complete
MNNYHFKISKTHFESLKLHLYPGDGLEAVSIAICGRSSIGNTFLVHKLINIPHNLCERTPNYIKWPTSLIAKELPKMVEKDFALFKIHSHPGGYNQFSNLDDKSDLELFDSIYGWYNNANLHGSLVLLPDDKMFGRVVEPSLKFSNLNKISIVDRKMTIYQENQRFFNAEVNLRNSQTLGKGTQTLLKNLKVGVVGCSGTGSPVIEQLARLGVGSLVLVDPDIIEKKNLNRILNSTEADAASSAYKVDVAKTAIEKMGFSTNVKTFNTNIYEDFYAVNELSDCDLVFGCMDSVDGRHLLNTISSFYLVPYIDIGIKIISDKKGGIDQICGTIHYILPGESSLQTRGVFTHEVLRSANMLRVDQKEYDRQKESGYIVDVDIESPAVISINMLAASLAVNEFLSRLHDIKNEELSDYDIIRFSLTDYYLMNEKSNYETDVFLGKNLGRGNMIPLLNMPEFSYVEKN